MVAGSRPVISTTSACSRTSAVGVERDRPRLLRHQGDRVPDGLGDREPHRVLHRAAPAPVLAAVFKPVSQSTRSWEAPAPSARTSRFAGARRGPGRSPRSARRCGRRRCWTRRCPGATPRPATPGCCRTTPPAGGTRRSFERRRGVLLLGVDGHDRGVHVQHDDVGRQGRPGHLRGGHPAGDQVPHPGPGLRPRRGDPLQRCRGQLVQGPPRRRCRRHRPSTPSWWRRVSMSAMASPPAVTIVATSTRTRPRS
jgi:hypothetical protein